MSPRTEAGAPPLKAAGAPKKMKMRFVFPSKQAVMGNFGWASSFPVFYAIPNVYIHALKLLAWTLPQRDTSSFLVTGGDEQGRAE